MGMFFYDTFQMYSVSRSNSWIASSSPPMAGSSQRRIVYANKKKSTERQLRAVREGLKTLFEFGSGGLGWAESTQF